MSEEKTIQCFAVSPIRLGGKKKVDCLVDLTPEQYDSLSKLKPSPIRKVEAETEAEGVDVNTVDVDALVAAVDAFDPENKEHFGADGKPSVKALSAALETKINAKKRDQLWQLYQDIKAESGTE